MFSDRGAAARSRDRAGSTGRKANGETDVAYIIVRAAAFNTVLGVWAPPSRRSFSGFNFEIRSACD